MRKDCKKCCICYIRTSVIKITSGYGVIERMTRLAAVILTAHRKHAQKLFLIVIARLIFQKQGCRISNCKQQEML